MNPIKFWMEDARKQPDVRRVDTCDGVRALAIMIVVWYHIWQQSWLYPEIRIFGKSISFDPLVRSGYIWVDIMILISGFCLYLPWARLAQGEKGQSPLAFYRRRLIRIHPSYLLTLAIMFGVALATEAYGNNRAFMAAVVYLRLPDDVHVQHLLRHKARRCALDAGTGNAALCALSALCTRV